MGKNIPLNIFSPTPKIWWRYVDNTFTVLKTEHTSSFFTHINSLVMGIKFTFESENEQGELAMLDCKIKRTEEDKLHTGVYKKPTHSSRYLDLNSSHPLSIKADLVKCLTNRAIALSSTTKNLNDEMKQIEEALVLNN
ncbi:unnamed protein product [Trichobilharzia szidati]|nr:unnamed protein product [Trichobilharzia szidati]